MLDFIRKNRWLFLFGSIAAILLRLLFILRFARITSDALIYSDIAQNLIAYGKFAMTDTGVPVPTLIRLPGYPAFLALVFLIFGVGNLKAALFFQMFVDVGACFYIAAIARELFTDNAAKAAFLLAALCPFTANYVAHPLTETLAIFFASLALLEGVKASRRLDAEDPRGARRQWIFSGLAISAGIYLRPDGGILLAALLAYLGWRFLLESSRRKQLISAAVLVSVCALAPLTPWIVRNWVVFGVFQPLAPRYATAPGEYVPLGFNRWMKTWIVDYVSVEQIYWKVSTESPGEELDSADLPDRAFDSADQRAHTDAIFDEFNDDHILHPQTDAAFGLLARERIAAHPFRYYVTLPAARTLSIWFRPRIEMLPLDARWWATEDPREFRFTIPYGILNTLLVIAALAGAVRFRKTTGIGTLLAFVLLRSAFLSTIENPEPRYILECFPVVLALAGVFLATITESKLMTKDGRSYGIGYGSVRKES